MESMRSIHFSIETVVSLKRKITAFLQAQRVQTTCPHCSSSINTVAAPPPVVTPPISSGDIEWWLKLLAICFSALQSANQCIQYQQTTNQPIKSHLPGMYYLFCFALMVAFVSLVLSKYVASTGSKLQYMLEISGYLFATVSFFANITMLFPISVIFPGWAVFSITIIIIVLSYFFRLNRGTQSPSTSVNILPI